MTSLQEHLRINQQDGDEESFDGDGDALLPLSTRISKALDRDSVSFWIFGLCNNFGYVIMISAAHDMLLKFAPDLGTGVVLLADIVPTVIIKPLAPWMLAHFSYAGRITTAAAFGLLSFILVAFASNLFMALSGVVCASISSGLGEVTFLAFSSTFNKPVISGWSSGTGAAGVVGSVSYLGLTMILSPQNTCLAMTVVPLIMLVVFFCGLSKKQSFGRARGYHMMAIIRRLLMRYMAPLFVVYFAEYTINQTLYEHIVFKDAFVHKASQYRLYQSLYQAGVFVSRSSLSFFPLKRIWVPSMLQVLNLVLLALDTYYQIIPSIWPILAWIVFEGLLGGITYVNAFHLISLKFPDDEKEFAMGVASVADACGIALAGAVSAGLNDVYKSRKPR